MKYTIEDFKTEIECIPDEDIRAWTLKAFENCPEDFYVVPASSSGKYHPADEKLEGGTAIHIKRAFKVMLVLCDSESDILTREEISILLSAILLHDICRGAGRTHPEAVRPYYAQKLGDAFVEQYPDIMDAIETHMGRWGRHRPDTLLQALVHYADNVASKLHQIYPEGNVEVMNEVMKSISNANVKDLSGKLQTGINYVNNK